MPKQKYKRPSITARGSMADIRMRPHSYPNAPAPGPKQPVEREIKVKQEIGEKKEIPPRLRTMRILAWVVLVVVLFFIGFKAYLFLTREASPAADILPEDTAFFWEINLDLTTTQGLKLAKLFEPLADAELRESLALNLEKGLAALADDTDSLLPLLSRRLGLAVLPQKDTAPSTVLMIGLGGEADSALRFDRWESEGFQGVPIYKVGQAADAVLGQIPLLGMNIGDFGEESRAAVVGSYLVLADNRQGLEEVIRVSQGQAKGLTVYRPFANLQGKMPREYFAFFYVNTRKLAAEYEHLAGNNFASQALFQVIMPQGEVAALTLTAEGSDLKFWGQEIIDRSIDETDFTKILESVPDNTAFVVSGADLATDISDTTVRLKERNPIYDYYLVNFKDRLKDTYGFDLDQDVLAWLDSPWSVLGWGREDGRDDNQGKITELIDKYDLGFVFPLTADDYDAAQREMPKLEEAAKVALAKRGTKEEPRTLPDGSTATELVPLNSEDVEFRSVDFEGITIRLARHDQVDLEFAYAFADSRLLVATRLADLEDMIKATRGGSSILDQEDFAGLSSQVQDYQGYLTYFNLASILAQRSDPYSAIFKDFLVRVKDGDLGPEMEGVLRFK